MHPATLRCCQHIRSKWIWLSIVLGVIVQSECKVLMALRYLHGINKICTVLRRIKRFFKSCFVLHHSHFSQMALATTTTATAMESLHTHDKCIALMTFVFIIASSMCYCYALFFVPYVYLHPFILYTMFTSIHHSHNGSSISFRNRRFIFSRRRNKYPQLFSALFSNERSLFL